MARVMCIYDWNTGKLLKKAPIPKAEGKSISYEVEHISAGRYLVVRDYYDNKILHKINVDKYGSIEFEPKYEGEEY